MRDRNEKIWSRWTQTAIIPSFPISNNSNHKTFDFTSISCFHMLLYLTLRNLSNRYHYPLFHNWRKWDQRNEITHPRSQGSSVVGLRFEGGITAAPLSPSLQKHSSSKCIAVWSPGDIAITTSLQWQIVWTVLLRVSEQSTHCLLWTWMSAAVTGLTMLFAEQPTARNAKALASEGSTKGHVILTGPQVFFPCNVPSLPAEFLGAFFQTEFSSFHTWLSFASTPCDWHIAWPLGHFPRLTFDPASWLHLKNLLPEIFPPF